jgi:hypothetical protein
LTTASAQEGVESPVVETPIAVPTELSPSPTFEAPTPDFEVTPVGGCAIG